MLDHLSPDGAEPKRPLPGELWSLWDMYNFVAGNFRLALEKIQETRAACPTIDEPVPSERQKDYLLWFQFIEQIFGELQMPQSHAQASWIVQKLYQNRISSAALHTLADTLLGLVETEANKVQLYVYPNDRAAEIVRLDQQWGTVFAAFKSAKPEIRAGIDLWALGHATASVFHMMRAAEIAVRVLANERGVTFPNKPTEWSTWGDLAKAIDNKVLDIKQNKPNGPKKDVALSFYADAVSHLRSLNGTRDLVMHVRQPFTDEDASAVIGHVRAIMTTLATKLDESSGTPIDWGI